MIKRVYVPLYTEVAPPGGVSLTQLAAGTARPTTHKPVSRKEAVRIAMAALAERGKWSSIIFKTSGKKDARLRWLDFEVS